MERSRIQGKAEGKVEGKLEGKLEERSSMITTALQGGSTVEEIARVMQIPIEEVETIAVQAENVKKVKL